MGEKEILESFFEEGFIMQLLGYKKKTMACYRSAGRSDLIPPSQKLGVRHVYPKDKALAWFKEKGIGLGMRVVKA